MTSLRKIVTWWNVFDGRPRFRMSLRSRKYRFGLGGRYCVALFYLRASFLYKNNFASNSLLINPCRYCLPGKNEQQTYAGRFIKDSVCLFLKLHQFHGICVTVVDGLWLCKARWRVTPIEPQTLVFSINRLKIVTNICNQRIIGTGHDDKLWCP